MPLIQDLVRYLLGQPPTDCQWLEYLFGGVIAIMLIKWVTMLFQYVLKVITPVNNKKGGYF